MLVRAGWGESARTQKRGGLGGEGEVKTTSRWTRFCPVTRKNDPEGVRTVGETKKTKTGCWDSNTKNLEGRGRKSDWCGGGGGAEEVEGGEALHKFQKKNRMVPTGNRPARWETPR